MKRNHFILIALLVGGNIVISCTPRYTASFGPSQQFYEPDRVEEAVTLVYDGESTVEVNTVQEVSPASEKNEQLLVASAKTEKAVNIQPKKAAEVVAKYQTKNTLADKGSMARLSPKEKKEVIREVERDIKELKKAKKKASIENRKVYSGIIIAAAGLLVAILVSGTLGGLGILVGIVLIAWGLIEEGEL